MLSAEEVQKIIDDIQALKNVKVNPKQAAAGAAANKAEERVMPLQQPNIFVLETITGQEERRRQDLPIESGL